MTAVNAGGQITGAVLLTGGSYAVAPCSPAEVIGGHGCFALFGLTVVLPAVTIRS